MSEPQQATIVLYEVFTGTLEDGRQVMVQVFRRQGQDKSIFAQLAFRDHSGQSWAPPVRLDDRHQITETSPA